jgi:hypothetical protein
MEKSREWPTAIPDLTTVGAALYVHDFVEWATDVEGWVSDFAPATRNAKLEAIAYMRAEGVAKEELDFLVACEEDGKIAKLLARLPVRAQ